MFLYIYSFFRVFIHLKKQENLLKKNEKNIFKKSRKNISKIEKNI